MATLFTISWRDLNNDPAVSKLYVRDDVSGAQRTALLDAMQGLSDIALVSTNKITLEAYAGVQVAAAKTGANHADDREHASFIFDTTNPAEKVRVSVFGPKATLPIGNDNSIDVSDAMFDDLKAAVIAAVRSNSGATPTVMRSAKLISTAK